MLKALLKKQLLEIGAQYLSRRAAGKAPSKTGKVLFICLYAFLFLFLCASFFVVSMGMAIALIPTENAWLYFALMGLLALMFGVFGSVFNTYAGLYRAKDNDLLLSMPIPPRMILLSRMIGVFTVGMIFLSVVFLPAIAAYCIVGAPTVLSCVNLFLTWLLLGFLNLALTCLLGWVVALIADRTKNKGVLTVIVSLALFGIYYYFCFNAQSLFSSLLANADRVTEVIHSAAYPLYLMGKGCVGEPLPMLGFALIIAALTALVFFILSKTFLRLTTKNTGDGGKARHITKTKSSSAGAALFRKEWKYYLSSAAYMLNCSLGSVLMVAAGVVVLVIRDRIDTVLSMLPIPGELIVPLLPAAVCLFISTNFLCAPSVSLEGKNIWILQSMPVDSKYVLRAKQALSLSLTVPPALVLSVCLGIAFRCDVPTIVCLVVISVLYAMFSSAFGLTVGLYKANLNWVSETVVIKQGLAVGVTMLGGIAASALIGVGGFFCAGLLGVYPYFAVLAVLLAAGTVLLDRLLDTKGAAYFRYL